MTRFFPESFSRAGHLDLHPMVVLVLAADQVADGSDRLKLAFCKDSDTITDHLDVWQYVGTEEDRLPLFSQSKNDVADIPASNRIEPGHRLIQDHEQRIVDQGLGDTDTLQHSLRELSELNTARIPQTHLFEQRVNLASQFTSAHVEQPAIKFEKFFCGQIVIKI